MKAAATLAAGAVFAAVVGLLGYGIGWGLNEGDHQRGVAVGCVAILIAIAALTQVETKP